MGSTNDLIAELAELGAPEGTCVVAEEQVAGRGRRGRAWISPPGSGLWVSVLIRPGDRPREAWGVLPLLAGLAARSALIECGVPAALKWPNDLVIDADPIRKLGGILVQATDNDACVIGTGINTSLTREELPTEQATSVLLEDGEPDRTALLAGYLRALATLIARWHDGDTSLIEEYRAACASLGRTVDVHLPDGSTLRGVALGIDDEGHLIVEDSSGARTIVTAGDVVHATIKP